MKKCGFIGKLFGMCHQGIGRVRYMTKSAVESEFRSYNLPAVYQKHGWKRDVAAIRQAWNDHLDFLQKEGLISEHQANTWVNPFVKKNER